MAPRPPKGLCVLDIGTLIAGPFGASLLGIAPVALLALQERGVV